jgi:DNA replication and repair protein RecF
MRLASLHLKQFRNYPELTVSFSPGKNLFLGKNGQGKTNLLEALYFLSHSRSNRTGNDRELIQQGATQTLLRAEIASVGYAGTTQLEAILSISEEDRLKTLFRANGIPLKNRSQVLGFIPTVSFFLSDLLLLRGAPEDRRKWLDAAITQYDKRHFIYLAEFQRVRLQKNKLLRDEPNRISVGVLESLNQQFARLGARLVASRIQYLSLIQDLVTVKYLELAGSQEQLAVSYLSTLANEPESAAMAQLTTEEIEGVFTRLLQEKQAEEIRRGTSLVGPHRDDILFRLNNLDATAYGSQGQQRSIVLALKLTELSLLTHKLGEPPILLLDDVMAELDPKRQECLLDRIEGENQVFLTTTHLDDSLKPLISSRLATDQVAVFEVSAGSVARVQMGSLSL